MAKLLDRAKEGTQRGLTRSKQKLDDVQAQRAGQDLLRKLGAAYYKEQRGGGSSQDTQDALNAVTAHITDHGDAFLEHGSRHH